MNKQKGLPAQAGFTLIIVFFIMAIMLSIVLSLIMIILGQINSMKNFSNSVTAYYLAETGVEKTLYFDRRQIPDSAKRGLCNICISCVQGNTFNNCNDCTLTPLETTTEGEGETTSGCDIANCTNCELSYKTSLAPSGGKSFTVKATVTPLEGFSNTDIFASSNFSGIAKTIQSHFSEDMLKSSKPEITEYGVNPNSALEGATITIYATVVDANGIRNNGVNAFIKSINTDGTFGKEFDAPMSAPDGSTSYSGVFTRPVGVYSAYIQACNKLGKCSNKTIE